VAADGSVAVGCGGVRRLAAVVACAFALMALAGCGAAVSRPVMVASATQLAYPTVAAGRLGFDAVWAGQSGVWTDQWSYRKEHWNGPRLLSRRSTLQTPTEIADSPSGAAVAGWEYAPPDRGSGVSLASLAPQLLVRYRSPDGSWQPTLRLPTGVPLRPRGVGIDSVGDAFVVWQTTAKPSEIMLSEHTPTAKGWAEPQMVAPASGGVAAGPDIAVSPAGALAVAWSADRANDPPSRRGEKQTFTQLNYARVVVRSRLRQGRAWHTVRLGATGQRVTGAEVGEWPSDPVSVGINDSGTVVAGWQVIPASNGALKPRLAVVTDFGPHPRTRMVAIPSSSDVDYPTFISGRTDIDVNAGAWVAILAPTGQVKAHAALANWYLGPRPSVTRQICTRLKLIAPAEGVAVAPNGLGMTVYQSGPDTVRLNGIFSYTHPC
jgi:hypothetical protein